MSLASLSGRGFLLSDGVELKFSNNGNAWAKLPISFRNNKKNEDGTWGFDKEFKIDVMVFGQLAETLAEIIDGRVELAVVGEPYLETWTDKEGRERTSVRMIGASVWPTKPVARKPVSSGWGGSDDAAPF